MHNYNRDRYNQKLKPCCTAAAGALRLDKQKTQSSAIFLFFFSCNLMRNGATLPVSTYQVHLLEVIVVMGFVMSTVCP